MKKILPGAIAAAGLMVFGGPAVALDGEAKYDGGTAPSCASCHDGGIAGAPRLGNPDDWTDRKGKGLDELTQSVLDGIGAMPAYGGRYEDDEIRAAVEYMLSELD